MKVTLYVIAGKRESKVLWSIAPEIDYAYWLDEVFRAEVEQELEQFMHRKHGLTGGCDGAGQREDRKRGGVAGNQVLGRHGLKRGSDEAGQREDRKQGRVAGNQVDGRHGLKHDSDEVGQREDRKRGRVAGNQVEAYGDVGDRDSERLNEQVAVAAWSEPLPLGMASDIAGRWPSSGGPVSVEEARERLTRLVSEAVEADAGRGFMAKLKPQAHAMHVREPSARIAADGARALAAEACRAAALLQGRALLSSEALALLAAVGAAAPAGAAPPAWSAAARALQLAALLGQLRLGGAIAPQPQPPLLRWRQALGAKPRQQLRCQRCGSAAARMRRTPCAACGRACAYCEACLTMGRSRECGLLIHGTPNMGAPTRISAPTPSRLTAADNLAARLEPWKLSPAQEAAASAALTYIEEGPAANPPSWWRRLVSRQRNTPSAATQRRFLLWAVTGAGKTEMMFPLVESCIKRGGRALIATPRRDVVLELDPRIRRAFPQATVVTLYGGSEQRWEYGDITLATTHQLFRFRHAFDLVVIDELDAFPYHNDPMLHYAADQVGKQEAETIYLSATPPTAMRKEAQRGKLAHVRVPVRFHRHPLPVPNQVTIPPVRQMLHKRNLPRTLISALQRSISRGAQLFVFVQQIRDVEPLVRRLRIVFPAIVIEGTSSKDDERSDKVLRFRDRSIRLLVTTTILERGVTIAKSDVFILDADGKLFDDASLVQMAGRAGRSMDDPAGVVYFFASARNRAQQSAIRQIRGMNRIARKCGYLL